MSKAPTVFQVLSFASSSFFSFLLFIIDFLWVLTYHGCKVFIVWGVLTFGWMWLGIQGCLTIAHYRLFFFWPAIKHKLFFWFFNSKYTLLFFLFHFLRGLRYLVYVTFYWHCIFLCFTKFTNFILFHKIKNVIGFSFWFFKSLFLGEKRRRKFHFPYSCFLL